MMKINRTEPIIVIIEHIYPVFAYKHISPFCGMELFANIIDMMARIILKVIIAHNTTIKETSAYCLHCLSFFCSNNLLFSEDLYSSNIFSFLEEIEY